MTGMEGVQVISMSLGYVMGQALHAAAKLGVGDALAAGPLSADDVAANTSSHAPSMRRLLRTLASGGIVNQADDGRYSLTTLGETLRRDAAGSVHSAVVWVSEPMHYATCGDLAETVRTGVPAFERLFGKPYFEYLAADPGAGRVWDAGMACFSAIEDGPIARGYQFPKGATVIDVGGGQGGFLAEVLTADASLTGVLFDLPEVVAEPRRLLDARLEARFSTAAGDFFESVPAGGDVYVYKRVLHDWDDDHCVTLLRRCRDVISNRGRVLVIDAVIPPGNEPHPAKIVDIVMMGILSGRERTEAELASLFARAGFTLQRVIPTHSMLAIAEATPA